MALGALGGQSSGCEQLEEGHVLVCDIQGSHTACSVRGPQPRLLSLWEAKRGGCLQDQRHLGGQWEAAESPFSPDLPVSFLASLPT